MYIEAKCEYKSDNIRMTHQRIKVTLNQIFLIIFIVRMYITLSFLLDLGLNIFPGNPDQIKVEIAYKAYDIFIKGKFKYSLKTESKI